MVESRMLHMPLIYKNFRILPQISPAQYSKLFFSPQTFNLQPVFSSAQSLTFMLKYINVYEEKNAEET